MWVDASAVSNHMLTSQSHSLKFIQLNTLSDVKLAIRIVQFITYILSITINTIM